MSRSQDAQPLEVPLLKETHAELPAELCDV